MDQAQDIRQRNRGIATGVMCYLLWGLFPLYWKLLAEVDSLEVIAHRIIWCFATTVAICASSRFDLMGLLRQPRAWRYLAPAAVIITLNWSIYIFAVAIALCAAGMAFFTFSYGQFPWIALALAFSFGIYGAIKKKAGYPATPALAFENAVMVVPAVAFAVVLANVTGSHAFAPDLATSHGQLITALLVLAGPATAVPLILFAKAANLIPLSLLGFIQYLSPTIALLTGVFLFGEPFTLAHGVCLGCIWAGLVLVAAEAGLSH